MVAMARAVVCLSLWLSVCEVGGSHIPPKMNRTIQNLLQHYKISVKERFNGMPVFSRELMSSKMETKMLFMGGVLTKYEALIDQMLKQLPTPSPQTAANNEQSASAVIATSGTASDAGSVAGEDIRTELNYILTMVKKLKRSHYQQQEKVLQGLQDLEKIQMNDLVVQSKALWELPLLYEEASSLPNDIRMQRSTRRRRRQAKAKTRPRA